MEKENPNDGESTNYKVKFMCSYGGKILPRPSDHRLSYIGGDIKILTVDRNITFPNFLARAASICEAKSPISLKYQLPGHDLDSLISVIDDDDIEHMMYEYDCLRRIPTKSARLRLFIFFTPPVTSSGISNPDFLFGFDKEYTVAKSEIAEKAEPVPGDSASDPTGGSELQTPKQDIQGIPVSVPGPFYSVPRGGYTYHAPLFYRPPVVAGGYYQVAPYGELVANGVVGNREQPMYGFHPVKPVEQKAPMSERVSTSDCVLAYDSPRLGALQPTAAMGTQANHDNRVVGPNALRDA